MTALKIFLRIWNSQFSWNSLENNFLQNAFCFMLHWKLHNHRGENNHWLCYLYLMHRKKFSFSFALQETSDAHVISSNKYWTNLFFITFTIIFLTTFLIFIIRVLLQLTLLYIPWNCWISKCCCCCEATNNACNMSFIIHALF